MESDGAAVLAHLDVFLRIVEVPDDPRALNGLQVANSGRISRVAVAVDACQATIDRAAATGADFMVVHHGLFWDGLQPMLGSHGRRVRALIQNDIALYAAHLPLDCHPEVGNNAVLARDLGLGELEEFAEEQGVRIGVIGEVDLERGELARRLANRLGAEPMVVSGGPERVRRVAIVTGAGTGFLDEARECGADTLITGEGPHHSYFAAEEGGMNLVFGGHYATETVGVQALAKHLGEKFGLPWEFIDHPTGM